MSIKYSIAEARDKFTTVIRDSEQNSIYITRRGEPVAVILSMAEYEALIGKQTQDRIWETYQAWRKEWQVDDWTEDDDIFSGLRSSGSGRDIVTWD